MTDGLLIYGANGYTGEMIARAAVARGLAPILAGRSAGPIQALGRELGCESRVFGLADPAAIAAALAGSRVVLHCAGPFSATAAPMMAACLAARAHYTDITGEIEVFELGFRHDAAARQAGIVVCPGVGFDVVCDVAHVRRRRIRTGDRRTRGGPRPSSGRFPRTPDAGLGA